MTTDTAQALQSWLLVKAQHAKAVGEVSRLGREMGIAFNKMLLAVGAGDPLVNAEIEVLKRGGGSQGER